MKRIAPVAGLALALAVQAFPAEIATYHLKSGESVTGRRLGKMGGKVMLKLDDGKRRMIAEGAIARTVTKTVPDPPAPTVCTYRGKPRTAGARHVAPCLAVRLNPASLTRLRAPLQNLTDVTMPFLECVGGSRREVDACPATHGNGRGCKTARISAWTELWPVVGRL